MFKNQRHKELLDILKKEGFAEVRTLGERLYASQPTIRRDLDYLEKQGLVRRSHGGAILADDRINTPVSYRKGTRTQEKIRICRLAATLIAPGNLLFIDASSTALYLSDHLKEGDELTVVTYGYPICHTLVEKNVRTFSTGGRILKDSMAFVGQHAEETVKQFNADLMFFSASSVSEDGKISDYSEEEIALRRRMLTQSKRVVFLCNSAKIGTVSAFYAFSLSQVDDLITDAPLSPAIMQAYGFSLTREQGGAYLYHREKTAE